MQTPIQKDTRQQLDFSSDHNDDTNYAECRNYIDTFMQDGDEQEQFMSYQHQNALSSPFTFAQTNLNRQPLSSIQCDQDLGPSYNPNHNHPKVPPFELKSSSKGAAYTHCVKDPGRKDFSFIYDKANHQHRDHMLFNAFNDNESVSSSDSTVSLLCVNYSV